MHIILDAPQSPEDPTRVATTFTMGGLEQLTADTENLYSVPALTTNEIVCAPLATPVNAAFSINERGGHLAAGTYFYRIAATDSVGTTLASTQTSIALDVGLSPPLSPPLSTGAVTVAWNAVPGATGYNIYGRTTGAEQLLASVATTAWVDDGSITPSGALPTANTTGTATIARIAASSATITAITAATMTLSGLPTSDPHVAGVLWNSTGTLKVSAGS